jgi:hypothetical protein
MKALIPVLAMVRATFLALLVAVATCPIATAEDIPLNEIWAIRVPDTKDVRKLDDDQEKPLVEEITRAIKKTGPGFVVVGTNETALRNVHAIFVGKEKPRDSFEAGSELCLVFYSAPGSRSIWINTVARNGNVITVKHESIVQEASFVSPQLALIPLGKLAPGEYEVKIKQLPTLTPAGRAAPPDPRVCESFAFKVR